MKLKICYILHASNLTGANRSLVDMISAIRDFEVEPIVMLPREGPIIGVLGERGIHCTVLGYHNSIQSTSSVRSLAKSALRPVEVLKVKRAMDHAAVDFVHSNSLLSDIGMQAARELGVPYACHIRELVKEDHGLNFINENRTRWLVGSSSLCIAISQFVANKFVDWFDGDKIEVIPNGLDVGAYRLDHKPVLSDKKCRLLMAGRIAPGKGQLEAIKATEILVNQGYDVMLTVVGGDGRPKSYAVECREYVASHHLEEVVAFMGFTNDLTSLKKQSDISLTCSHAEALGRVTIEGMLAGCLVIGADAGATSEILAEGRTGLFYEVGSPESLAQKVVWAVEHREEARKVAVAGQEHAAETYDSFTYATKLAALYNQCVSS